MWYLIGNMAELFWDLCDLRNISTGFLKLHSHILVLWLFCRTFVISKCSFLDIEFKMKTQIPRKIFIFQLFLLKLYQIHFSVCLSLYLLTEFVIPLLNCFFRDFRVFDLVQFPSITESTNKLLLQIKCVSQIFNWEQVRRWYRSIS